MGLWDAPRSGRKRRWQDEDWQVVEQAVQGSRRYSTRQLSQKLFEHRHIHLGQEQVRRILKKGYRWRRIRATPAPVSTPQALNHLSLFVTLVRERLKCFYFIDTTLIHQLGLGCCS
jgi:transposase